MFRTVLLYSATKCRLRRGPRVNFGLASMSGLATDRGWSEAPERGAEGVTLAPADAPGCTNPRSGLGGQLTRGDQLLGAAR